MIFIRGIPCIREIYIGHNLLKKPKPKHCDEYEIGFDFSKTSWSKYFQSFEVHLLKVESGTAVLGTQKKVTVGILKNDSPSGVFGFIQTKQTVREPGTFASDVPSAVTFDVERLHGNDGKVMVTWRLSDRARDDFLQPWSGSLQFLQVSGYSRYITNNLSKHLRTNSVSEFRGVCCPPSFLRAKKYSVKSFLHVVLLFHTYFHLYVGL